MLAVLPHYVFADNENQLDTTSIPSKIIANTDGMIQVYAKNFTNTLNDLVATSSDSSIVEILSIEQDSTHGSFNVKIRALDSGQATISMAAPGYAPLEMPITIFPNSKTPTNLVIKATPQTFSMSGPNAGYVSVETVNAGGVPTPVSVDTPIKLSVSDSSIAELSSNQIIIKQGSYFATEKFVVSKPGSAQIYASASSMQPVATSVTIDNSAASNILQAYAYPPLVNVAENTVSFVIVQLHDAAGDPVIAKQDIPVSVRVIDSNDTSSINTSGQSPFAQVNGDLIIHKGSYWGYVPVEFTAGKSENYTVAISAKGYVISTIPAKTTITTSITGSAGSTAPGASTSASGTTTTTSTASANGTSTTTSTTTTNTATSGSASPSGAQSVTSAPSRSSATTTGTTTQTSTELSVCEKNPVAISSSQIQITALAQSFVMDDKTPCFYALPILATGHNELIGVLALKDSQGFPALAKSGLSFQMDSSDIATVSIPDVEMGYGDQSALVFAKVGNTANPISLNVVSGSPQQIVPIISSPSQTASGLVADPLIPTVLPNTEFPLAIYTQNNGELSSFRNDFSALMTPQESISPVQLSITNGEPVFLTDETLLKEGTQNIAITTPDYSSSFTVTGALSKPNGIALGYPDQIISNSNLLFSIELLDDKQIPILADKDMDIKLVSSNPSVLDVPDNVQIKQGSYYATFDAHSLIGGTAEIAVLSDGIPLSKFDITTTSYTPKVTIDSLDHADNNTPVTATVTASYNQVPLAGLAVNWTVTGGTIQNKDSLTGKDGKAEISLVTNDPNTVRVQASVGSGPYQTVTVSKDISINPPLQPTASQAQQSNASQPGITVMGLSPVLFVIPGAAAAAFVVLKKKNMLEGISERINLAEKFSEIRERMSNSEE